VYCCAILQFQIGFIVLVADINITGNGIGFYANRRKSLSIFGTTSICLYDLFCSACFRFPSHREAQPDTKCSEPGWGKISTQSGGAAANGGGNIAETSAGSMNQ
jgi:hypothetical protein